MHARALSCSALAFAAALGAGAPAHASAISLAGSVSFVGLLQQPNDCNGISDRGGQSNMAFGLATTLPSMSKASAILGGGASELDRIRQEQSGGSAGSAVRAVAVPASASLSLAGWRPAPSATGIDCSRFSLPRAPVPFAGSADGNADLRGDDYLMSRRLAVQHTAFDRQWDRVRNSGVSRSVARQFSATAHVEGSMIDDRLLAAVNGWTNHRIRYQEDSRLFGRADYWADAQATFRRGAGDCEDIAIAKLQLLARLGVPQSDMFLTIARDLARNADHAMLIVRRGDRYWLLDNGTDRVLDASANYDYRPIMSFSGDRKWLHGFATAQLGLN